MSVGGVEMQPKTRKTERNVERWTNISCSIVLNAIDVNELFLPVSFTLLASDDTC